MLRESSMPAILTEGGFMDSTTDIGALRSDAKLKAQGEAIADGLAVYFSTSS
ncbi:N-acetylmuramoyl-L-alanine amidase [Sporosarcina psychrophila]